MSQEPKTLEQAYALRNLLLEEKTRLNAELTDPSRTAGNRHVGRQEYLAWRRSIGQRINEIDIVLRRLKESIRRLSTERRDELKDWSVIDDGQERLSAFGKALDSVLEYVRFLEREVKDLKIENAQLREATGGDNEDIAF